MHGVNLSIGISYDSNDSTTGLASDESMIKQLNRYFPSVEQTERLGPTGDLALSESDKVWFPVPSRFARVDVSHLPLLD